MGGELDYSALLLLCEIYGVRDIEEHVYLLAAIRDHQRKESKNND